MSHAEYWDLVPGQLGDNEEVHVGYETKVEAERDAKEYYVPHGFRVEVRELNTIENELRVEDPNFDPNQSFKSTRWCPVITRV
ncbi:MAG: hypothetical protein FJ044_01200 [Candidatus Cloacimonetes bacterium]|nr:hypothetical protein [Candidatus Cloacimonadota bacterium]